MLFAILYPQDCCFLNKNFRVIAMLRVIQPAVWLLLIFGFSIMMNGNRGELIAADPPKGKNKANPQANKKNDPPPLAVPTRPITIAKVDPATKADVKASAAKIDQLIENGYRQHNIKPNPTTSDEQFIRRVYLEITGTIPNLNQFKAAMAKRQDPEWRANLIDQLLNTDGYASHMYNYWADILRIRDSAIQKSLSAAPYNEYIRQSLEQNKPYDKWVYEMLTATGKALDNPATGYWMRDIDMPLDSMSNTVRIFLGTQIGCAQCHDHPFDKWSQEQFYQMAAFTGKLSGRDNDKDARRASRDLQAEIKKLEPNSGGAKFRSVMQGNLMALEDSGAALRYPDEVEGRNKSVVTPQPIFSEPAIDTSAKDPRTAMATWMTSPRNPRFALTIANRLWKKVFGIGQIEPADDIKDETVAANPELMKYLTNEMVRLKFNQKEYLRILLNTKTWQREASTTEPTMGEPYHFAGPVLRRMTAEQVWDSFVTIAAFDDPNEFHKPPAVNVVRIVKLDLTKATAKQVIERSEDFREFTSRAAENRRMEKYFYRNLALVRASELSTPLPPGHFLRQFGQSDREQIEGSSLDGSVPQSLQMLNGPITHMLLEPDSTLTKNILKESTPAAQSDVIFQTVLSRSPTAEERKILADEYRQHGKAGIGHVVWALVNTPEFLFIQ
jgi:hypothetical protein